MLRSKLCKPCFVASSVGIRYKVFGARGQFQLGLTDVSNSRRHLGGFRIIYVDGTAWCILSNHVKNLQI